MNNELLQALGRLELLFAQLKARSNEYTAWLYVRELITMTNDGQKRYRITVIELHNKYMEAYGNGMEINPEELAVRYDVSFATGEAQLKEMILQLIPSLDNLIRYADSGLGYPH